jgi:hypothetical protein
MARAFNPLCWQCSQLSIDAARQLHGEEGDPSGIGEAVRCWDEKICHRRRSHYRNRADNNQKRKATYTATQGKIAEQPPIQIQAKLQPPPIALLYLYREARKDSHLHAISISIWQGDQKLQDLPATHCMGMTNSQIRRYLQEVLQELSELYNIKNFEPEIRYDPMFCPIQPCPLKPPQVDA